LSVADGATNGYAKGLAMITMGIGLVAGVFYWLASYKLAFWILIYAIIYGGLGILRGDNHARPIYRGDSEVTVAAHAGRLAHRQACRLSLTVTHP
jgi:uncharacterized membrane-anchored protein